MPCARAHAAGRELHPEHDEAEERDHAEQVAVGDDALDGPAGEEQPARPVEGHRHLLGAGVEVGEVREQRLLHEDRDPQLEQRARGRGSS